MRSAGGILWKRLVRCKGRMKGDSSGAQVDKSGTFCATILSKVILDNPKTPRGK